ncbi:MAG: methyltransferase domain-containing protein [bacterium]|nr:methyltransferase domain-containing protein [bacterium]
MHHVKNYLYRHPEYYELVYPEPDEATPRMCLRIFERYLGGTPGSVLDVGCGTGRDLAVLSRTCPDCWGVEYLEMMSAFASERHPHLRIHRADMRSVRLGRQFDAIVCLGSCFMYALTNEDVSRTLATVAAHAHEGTLLVLDIQNAAAYLGADVFREEMTQQIDVPGLRATAVSRNTFDRRRQRLVRQRTWNMAGQEPIEDYCEYRLFFPAELEHVLSEHGFAVAGMFDTKELAETDLKGSRLYVAAVKR